jgi:hypothetical protein
MSVTAMSRTFWTEFPELSYTDKKGNKVSIKNSTAKIVLLAIADNADDFGENSWQSLETIAAKSSIDRRSVIRVIKALVNHGFLQLAGVSTYGTNNYTVTLDKLGHPPKKRSKTGRPKSSDSESLEQKSSDPEVKKSDSVVESGDSGKESSDEKSPESSLNRPLPIQINTKDTCIEILQRYASSIFDFQVWHKLKQRLEKDDVAIIGDDKLMTIAGLSAKVGQFTEAEVYQDKYAPSFAKFGLLIRFSEAMPLQVEA